MFTAEAHVQRGVALMDEQMPGWHEGIDLDTLSISSCHHCILGQVFGDYTTGLDALEIESGGRYGFAPVGGISTAQLTGLWEKEIEARRDFGTAEVEERELALA